MPRLRVGTCSWKFPSWEGLVYSAPKGINYLAEYATRYDTVEVDQWFWSLFGVDSLRLPDPETVAAYRASVPDDFAFTVKAPNSITLTHLYRRKRSDALVANPYAFSADLVAAFVDLLEPLHDVLGPVMLQFGYLNRQMVASRPAFEAKLETLASLLPPGPTFGVELRNPRWFSKSFFDLLARHRLIPVLLDGYYMPPITDVYAQWREAITAHDTAVIRLHGPDRAGMEKRTGKRWDRVVEPRDAQLGAVVEMIEDLLGRGLDVYVNVNNHYEGSAPLTIERIRNLLARNAADE
jgi:uncharacterized protein YecE (DUF72 family)